MIEVFYQSIYSVRVHTFGKEQLDHCLMPMTCRYYEGWPTKLTFSVKIRTVCK